jgi:hypothetical protein
MEKRLEAILILIEGWLAIQDREPADPVPT